MPNDAIQPNPRWVTARQIAARYSVTKPTVFNWLRAGIIPAKVAVGRIYRFDLAEVAVALAQRSARWSKTGGRAAAQACVPESSQPMKPDPELRK